MAKKILVVDDEAMINKVLAMRLKTHGYDVEVATNGDEAFEAFMSSVDEGLYSLILMDIMMPGTNGIDAMRMIRSEEKKDQNLITCHTPIILISALAQPSILKNLAPWDAFIQKPYNLDVLIKMIEQLTSQEWPID